MGRGIGGVPLDSHDIQTATSWGYLQAKNIPKDTEPQEVWLDF